MFILEGFLYYGGIGLDDGFEYLGNIYKIKVINPDYVEKGVKEIKIDVKIIEGNLITAIQDGTVYQVVVILG